MTGKPSETTAFDGQMFSEIDDACQPLSLDSDGNAYCAVHRHWTDGPRASKPEDAAVPRTEAGRDLLDHYSSGDVGPEYDWLLSAILAIEAEAATQTARRTD